MKEKIGVIAIGQAGGNIGFLLKNKGFDVAFINSSEGDLETLQLDKKYKYHIANGLGCAKDRTVAKKIAKSDFNSINEFLESSLGNKDFYYIIFSNGGGTGSGISPVLADILSTHLNKKVGLITILPSFKDTLQAHINAYECLQEVSNLKNIGGIFLIDNNSNHNFSHINEKFVTLFDKIFEYKKYETIKGNIDEAEVLKLLETKGMIILASCENKETKGNLVTTNTLIENIKNGIFAPLENDGKIKYLGLSKSIKFDEELFFKEVGRYLDKFENTNKDYTLAILSGLSLPFKRVKDMRDKIMKGKETILSLEKESEVKLDDIDFLNFKSQEKENEIKILEGKLKSETKPSIDDLFAQYL